nr:ATP-binding cassette domain-containing protein [Dactylosporangium thailandense]
MADVLVAEGLGARTRRGWVFRGVDLTVGEDELVTLDGAAGSGRTSLLLALAGYFRTTEGTVRRLARPALGFVAGVNEPEPGLTVAEHVEERLVLLGRASWNLGRRRRQALDRLEGVPLDPRALGRDLDRLGAHLLCLTLAQVGEPGIILADDVDNGLSEVERKMLLEALRDTGTAVIVTERAA